MSAISFCSSLLYLPSPSKRFRKWELRRNEKKRKHWHLRRLHSCWKIALLFTSFAVFGIIYFCQSFFFLFFSSLCRFHFLLCIALGFGVFFLLCLCSCPLFRFIPWLSLSQYIFSFSGFYLKMHLLWWKSENVSSKIVFDENKIKNSKETKQMTGKKVRSKGLPRTNEKNKTK